MDDAAITVAMHGWERASDPVLSDISTRFRNRSLFKTYELFGEQAAVTGRADALQIARDVASRRGLAPEYYVGLDVATAVPFGAEADPLLVVFAKGPARPLSEVSFLLARLAGQVLSRVRIVMAPELRDEVTRALADEAT